MSIAKMTENELFVSLYDYLQENNYNVHKDIGNHYMFAQGKSKTCLVAHLDIAFQYPPKKFYRSKINKNVVTASTGLGADDRAGVYAIMALIDRGLRPSIIFTTGEEIGGMGAMALIQDFPKIPISADFLLEMDRKGKSQSVYYNCGNKEFETYINSFGFTTYNGIFSDIYILAPAWDIAAVNVSIGYENEHTVKERLNCKYLDLTIEKVNDIILSESKYYNFQEDAEFTFLKNCFSCTTCSCDNCEILRDYESKGEASWLRKALR